jgi:hypothetical protein
LLATGFIENAKRFLSSDKAQAAADTENKSNIWSFQWSVTQQQFDVISGRAV